MLPEVGEQIDARRVGPVDIVQEQHQRSMPGHFVQEHAEFAFADILAKLAFASASTRARDGSSAASGASCTYQVGASSFIACAAAAPPSPWKQAVERFQEGQIGLGAGEAFGTATAGEAPQSAGRRQLVEEALDEGGLAKARLARDAEELAAPGGRLLEAGSQGGPL